MRLNTAVKTLTILLLLFTITVSAAYAASAEEKRDGIRKMRNETLQKLYTINPSAQSAVQDAYGYAVFNNSDFHLGLLGGGGGKGLAVINSTGGEIFMKTLEGSVGLGFGIKQYMMVFVFATEKAFFDFTDQGWEWGGQATAAITDSVSGGSLQGAISVAPDIWVYQMTNKGLGATLTLRGIRFYKNNALNQ
ncbi:MAG: hypothetical protein H6Q65_545 [Firmicutes bacterium]|nr:hypothetical protein [Bacillota bacterium]